jgi:hypothetical protein
MHDDDYTPEQFLSDILKLALFVACGMALLFLR